MVRFFLLRVSLFAGRGCPLCQIGGAVVVSEGRGERRGHMQRPLLVS